MIKLVLLTGFLGTRKTTLIQSILDSYQNEKIGVIINEFGDVNIDAALVKREGIEMMELSNGSIFCACIKDHFVNSLIAMSKEDISCLFIEASGLADPASMRQILTSVEPMLGTPYAYEGSICVVDAETFLELSEILPALGNQVEYASALIINKADLVAPEKIEEISEELTERNPDASQYVTSYCRTDMKALVEGLAPVERAIKESTNTVDSRPKTFGVKSGAPVDSQALLRFLKELAPDTYRMKGFVLTEKGVTEVSAVKDHIHLTEWSGEVPAMELVIISSVGIRLMSKITEALKDEEVKGKLHL